MLHFTLNRSDYRWLQLQVVNTFYVNVYLCTCSSASASSSCVIAALSCFSCSSSGFCSVRCRHVCETHTFCKVDGSTIVSEEWDWFPTYLSPCRRHSWDFSLDPVTWRFSDCLYWNFIPSNISIFISCSVLSTKVSPSTPMSIVWVALDRTLTLTFHNRS